MKNYDFIYSLDGGISYPEFPYSPDKKYAEFRQIVKDVNKNNSVYSIIRKLFLQSGYDQENVNTEKWNPFRGLIKEGGLILLKPNLVYEEAGRLLKQYVLTTHSSVMRPILDYLFLLQKQDGLSFEIVIGDVPLQSANWDEMILQNRLQDLISFYQEKYNFKIKLLDLRKEIALRDEKGFIFEKKIINGDPQGYTNVHLERSFLNDIIDDYKKFAVGDYSSTETVNRHSDEKHHYYQIPNTVLQADLFINLPKVKTHQKAGITIALKNLIGINGDKSWIPHYRKGSTFTGGDEYSNENLILKYLNSRTRVLLQGKNKRLWHFLKYLNTKIIKNLFSDSSINKSDKEKIDVSSGLIMDGAWHGNDTLWRSILDLNYLLLNSDKKGNIISNPNRKYIVLSDGIVAGEGNGPLKPYPKRAGLITLSENPVISDICISTIMGFDWQKIPQLKQAVLSSSLFKLKNIKDINIVESAQTNIEKSVHNLKNLKFVPSPGWLNYIEKE